jgi:DHA1 family tetracycline resistance protein-like MFS transporter
MKKPLGILFAVAFLDLLSFSLILPLLPYYAEHFGATPLVIGLLTSAYAVGQVIGAPVIGRLSDRFGRKPLLVPIVAGSALNFLILALVPLAFGQGRVTTLNRSLLSKAVDREEIGGTLGLMSSIESGINVLAPLLGGALIGGVGTWAPGVLGAVAG